MLGYRLLPRSVSDLAFCDIAQRRVGIPYDVLGQSIGSLFKDKFVEKESFFLNFLNFEDGTYRLTRNVGKNLLLCTVQYPRES
jgi:hypothetical protein